MNTLFRVAMSFKKHQLQAQTSTESLIDVSLALRSISGTYLLSIALHEVCCLSCDSTCLIKFTLEKQINQLWLVMAQYMGNALALLLAEAMNKMKQAQCDNLVAFPNTSFDVLVSNLLVHVHVDINLIPSVGAKTKYSTQILFALCISLLSFSSEIYGFVLRVMFGVRLFINCSKCKL